jgi:hypothetical protein
MAANAQAVKPINNKRFIWTVSSWMQQQSGSAEQCHCVAVQWRSGVGPLRYWKRQQNSKLSLLRRLDCISLAGKIPGGLEGLFPGHPARNHAPAGIIVEDELPDDRTVFGPDLEAIVVLDDSA